MAIYNDSWMENVTNPVDIMVGIGNAVGDNFLIGYFILFSFFIIFLILTIRFDFGEVLVVDSFLTTILAILLYTVELIPGTVIVWPAIVLFIGLIFVFMGKR